MKDTIDTIPHVFKVGDSVTIRLPPKEKLKYYSRGHAFYDIKADGWITEDMLCIDGSVHFIQSNNDNYCYLTNNSHYWRAAWLVLAVDKEREQQQQTFYGSLAHLICSIHADLIDSTDLIDSK